MANEKRERQRAQKAAQIEAEQAAARARRTRLFVIGGAVAAVVVLVAVLLVVSGDGGGKGDKAASSAATCPTKDNTETRLDFEEPPPTCIDPAKTYTAVFTTNLGKVEVPLDQEQAPNAVNNFVFLAGWHYYDDTTIFRAEPPSGVIQGGSPHTQDASDPGPGYTFADEGLPFPATAYGPGALAMANHGPDTNGGQFFFVGNENGSYLGQPAETGGGGGAYVVFGQATKGIDVLQKILDTGDAQTGAPAQDVTIETVRIRES